MNSRILLPLLNIFLILVRKHWNKFIYLPFVRIVCYTYRFLRSFEFLKFYTYFL